MCRARDDAECLLCLRVLAEGVRRIIGRHLTNKLTVIGEDGPVLDVMRRVDGQLVVPRGNGVGAEVPVGVYAEKTLIPLTCDSSIVVDVGNEETAWPSKKSPCLASQ